jgi:NTE family protein
MREMRAVIFVSKLIEEHRAVDPSMRHVFIHCIADDNLMTGLGVASKLRP